MRKVLTTSGGRKSGRRGFSLVEVILSLGISAMLLVAVSGAFTSSCDVVENNDEFFRASQAARVSLNHILAEIRRCHAVDVIASPAQVNLITADGNDRSYTYDSTTRRLKLVDNEVLPHKEYTLASNVEGVVVGADTAVDDNGHSYASRISVTLTVNVGGNQLRLTGSAAPRRMRVYE